MANHKSQFASATHLYSVFFAPRGNTRMFALGRQIAQEYLRPEDQLIGIIGDAGSGKSVLVKGMFPGLELTNDDEGVNIRPLPIMDMIDDPLSMNFGGLTKSGLGLFATPHTYHIDIRFEQGFSQMSEIVAAVTGAIKKGKRVIVEHFDLLYPHLKTPDSDLCINADLMVGIGAEVMVTRPNIFGPFPQDIADIAFRTIKYRKMVHTAEDLVGYYLEDDYYNDCDHWDVKNGFVLGFREKPKLTPQELEERVKADIAKDLPVSFSDEGHIKIGDVEYYCTAPRNHVRRTSEIEGFTLMKEMPLDPITGRYLLVGLVGQTGEVKVGDDIDKIRNIF